MVDPFSDKNNETSERFTVTGKTYPYSTLEITISPDTVKKTVQADKNGLWKYQQDTPLALGEKTMVVTSTSQDGVSNSVTIPFTVQKKKSFTWIFWLILLLIIAAAWYIWKKIKDAQYIPPIRSELFGEEKKTPPDTSPSPPDLHT